MIEENGNSAVYNDPDDAFEFTPVLGRRRNLGCH